MHSGTSRSSVLARVQPWLRCIGLLHVYKYQLATRSCKRMIAKARIYLCSVLFGYCERSRRAVWHGRTSQAGHKRRCEHESARYAKRTSEQRQASRAHLQASRAAKNLAQSARKCWRGELGFPSERSNSSARTRSPWFSGPGRCGRELILRVHSTLAISIMDVKANSAQVGQLLWPGTKQVQWLRGWHEQTELLEARPLPTARTTRQKAVGRGCLP